MAERKLAILPSDDGGATCTRDSGPQRAPDHDHAFPSFFILGAAKSGTTSLHAWLDQHRDITMSQPKEPLFFEAEYDRGIDFYRATYFRHWDGVTLTGESRHRNLYLPYIPQRIAATAPNARFIAILRNPVARAYSHWWHFYRSHHGTLDFDDALRADLRRIEAGEVVDTPDRIDGSVAGLMRDKMGPHRTYIDTG